MRDKIIATFIDLLKSSALVQGSIALVSVVAVTYLYVSGKQVPDTLVAIVMTILGYYFGTKTQQRSQQEMIDNVTSSLNRADSRTDRPVE